jgi:hypothetical protein
MKYTKTNPCDECPFLEKFKKGFSKTKLESFASGEFACHKTCDTDNEEGVYEPTKDSVHCAGALIYLEKRERSTQMMRICERLGMYDRTKLDMDAKVR